MFSTSWSKGGDGGITFGAECLDEGRALYPVIFPLDSFMRRNMYEVRTPLW